jgi:phosphatidylserine/phosphatidylglycerophosphate/cardiolipin synthase-like enzyme
VSFHSPLSDPATWQLSVRTQSVPGELRYSGYPVRALIADRGAGPAAVVAPFPAAVRMRLVTPSPEDPTATILELQPLGARFSRLARALSRRTPSEPGPAGLPALYCFLPQGAVVSPTDQQLVTFGESLATVASVRLALVYSDRLPREPALWASHLLQAINTAGEDASMWEPFAAAIDAQTSGASAPVLLLDHRGAPLTSGLLEIDVANMTYPVSLDPADGGDLQAAIARLNAADPVAMPLANLWGGGAVEAVVRPTGAGSASGAAGDVVQLARLDDGVSAAGQITITPQARHVLATDLTDWFAPQYAVFGNPPASRLARYTRGNLVRPIVSGHEYFDDLFAELATASQTAVGGFHLAGGSIHPDAFLSARSLGSTAASRKLENLAAAIGESGGRCNYLPTGFIQIDDQARLQGHEAVAVLIAVGINVLMELTRTGPGRIDGTGILLGLLVVIGNPVVVDQLLNRQILEPNHGAVGTLDALAGNNAVLSFYPLSVADNPREAISTMALIGGVAAFAGIQRFNVYHQRIAIVRREAGFVAYCGGMDLNPDRLDDHRHLAAKPSHDAHIRIEGPAVRDLVTTFDERWQRDGQAAAPAFLPADVDVAAAPGDHIVQIARTYGRARNSARALEFAPQGDRTILDTYLRAIAQAREFIYIEDAFLTPPPEFVAALLARLTGPDPIRRLIIVIPDVTDQPFGEMRQTDVIARLRAAGTALGLGVVRIGSPRRRVTVPDIDLRASSGRLILRDFITSPTGETVVALWPTARLPDPPFWISVDGELMWVYDEASAVVPVLDPSRPQADLSNSGFYVVERGNATRIVSGIDPGRGSTLRDHATAAAATIVHMEAINVNAKLMVVDDVFLCIGSSNLNRRGFYSDGECNAFVVPERLGSGPDNPVRAVRKRLWAEMLNLPHCLAEPLLEDPIAASALFDRSYFLGNRYAEAVAFPTHVLVKNFVGGNGLIGNIFNLLAGTGVAIVHEELFDTLVDPSTELEP